MKNIIAFLVLLLPVTAWIAGRQGNPRAVTESPVQNADFFTQLSMEPLENKPAPDFSLRDLDGNTVRLHDLKGKVVLLSFWATWCPSCRFEMPSMAALHQELSSKGLVVLPVSLRESAEDIQSFYKENDLSLPALLDLNAGVSELYDTWSLPTTFLIDKRGHLVGRVIGYRDWDSDRSKEFIVQLLNQSA